MLDTPMTASLHESAVRNGESAGSVIAALRSADS
jgi:hypothetical protein